MKSARSRFALELLEARQMLTLAAAGVEFMVNSYTTGTQGIAGLDVAADADGDFVVVWDSPTGDGSSYALFAQRFNASGVKQGSEFHPNTFTTNVQALPSVAMDADGDFVIAWMSTNQDGSGNGVFAQRYNAAGVAQGAEFRVNTYTTSSQTQPVAAMDAAGNFVIAWASVQTGDTAYGIYAQRYNFAGVAQGSEFHVNTYTANSQDVPAIAMDAAGDFVIGWRSFNQESPSGGYGVYARRFNSTGTAQGTEFLVNTFTTGIQQFPSIAMDFTGNFVIAWESQNQDGASWGIYARRYDSAGVAQQASEFKVNTYTTSSQRFPGASADADGDFIISWTSTYQTSAAGLYDVYAKRYNSASAEQPQPTGTTAGLGSEFLVNTYTTNLQYQPTVAMDAKGDAIIAYKGTEPTDTGGGIYAQRYSESVDTAPPIVAGVFVNGSQVLPYQAYRAPASQIVVSFSEDMSTAGGVGGAGSITNPANWLITRDGVSLTPLSIGFALNATTNRYEATINFPEEYLRGNFQLKIRQSVQDLSGNALDGNMDGAAGGNFVTAFSVTLDLTPGATFLVDSFTTTASRVMNSVLMDDSGNATVSWIESSFGFPSGSSAGYAKHVNTAGTITSGLVGFPVERTVAMDSTGNYVVARLLKGGGLLDPVYGVGFERFNSSDVSQGTGTAHQVTGVFQSVGVDMDSAGNFVITWSDGDEITARRFNSAGAAQGSEFHVNSSTTGAQKLPSVIMDEQGDFVVAWESYHGGTPGFYAQRYSPTGVAQGSEFRVDDAIHAAVVGSVSLAIDSDGDFIAAWTGYTDSEIYARRFDRFGNAIGGSFLVNAYTTGAQAGPSVAMDDAGDALIMWQSVNHSGAGYGIYARMYGRDGVASGEFTVLEGPLSSATFTMNDAGDLALLGYTTAIFSDKLTLALPLRPLAATPTVGALADTPDPVTRGDPLSLTASGITGVFSAASVSFYRESNGILGLQTGPEGDTFISTDSSGGDGWTASAATISLAPGTYTYYAQATDSSGLAGAPATTTNAVVAGSRPLVISSVFYYETSPNKLMFTFDRDVHASVSVNDLEVDRLLSINDPAFTMLPYGTDGTNVVTFVFTNPLAEANYRGALGPNIFDPGTSQPMASQLIFDFFVLNGDANHDRRVNLYDLVIVATNWKGAGKTYSQGDFDGDGDVDASDLAILAQNWQQGLVAPAAPLAPAPTSVAARAPVRSAYRVASNSNSLLE